METIEKRRVGIKYCGGCNPYYDRVALIQHVCSLLKDRVCFLRPDHDGLHGLILVSGCPRACAMSHLDQADVPIQSVISEGDLESLVAWLKNLR